MYPRRHGGASRTGWQPLLGLILVLVALPLWADDSAWPVLLHRSYEAAEQRARGELAAAQTPVARLEALQRLAELYSLYERPRELQEVNAQARSLPAQDLDAAARLAFALHAARAASIEGHHGAALKLLQDAQPLRAQASDPALGWRVRAELANTLAELGDYESATREASAILEEATRANHGAARADALEALALAAYLMQDYGRALAYHREAAELIPPESLQDLATARMGVAQMTNVLGERETALAMLPPVLEVFRAAGNLAREADALLLQGYFLDKLERPEAALEAHRAALALRERVGSPVALANSHAHIAGVLRRLGRQDEAVQSARKAVELAEVLDDASGQWDAYAGLAQSLAERGEYREAFEYMHRAERALLQRSRVDLLERTAALRERYDAERRELENRELNARLVLERIAQRRLILGIVLASVLASALLALAVVLQRQVKRNRDLSRQDVLTGHLNRRAVFADAAVEFARAERYGYALSVLLFDIDEFKRINDEFGHGAGDQTLRRVGEACLRLVRGGDLCGRIGGEEFLLVLPHTAAPEAHALAERLRLSIANEIRVEGDRVVTVSVGVAQMNGHAGDTLEALVQRADEAMYRAKRSGRNRTEMAA